MAIRAGFRSVLVATALAGGCVACTSAPIDMRAEDPLERGAVVEQSALRVAAAELSALVETNGWAQTDNAEGAARAMLARLIGGGGAAEDARASTVTAYLDAHDDPAQAAQEDLARLSDSALEVARLAITVASVDGQLPQAALARDIAASESALGALRRAHAFFDAVREEAVLDEAADSEMAASIEVLGEAETALARGADALAERRWATRSGLFG